MSKVEECTVTITREGVLAYTYTVTCAGPLHLAVWGMAMTRRGAARLGRRIARDHLREQDAYHQWIFTVRPEHAQ